MAHMRINPKAVCRSLLTRLDAYKPLSATDEYKLATAIKTTGISTERVLASLSRNTIKEILKEI